jgi:hypothetical protein
MKKLTLSLLIMAVGLLAYSQKIDKSQVPEAVKKMFEVKTNDTITPVWEKSGEIYIASFTKGELKAQVVIGSKADWQKTIWDMPYQYVPQKIKDNLLKDYAGFKVAKTTIQYRTDGDFYVIETKKKKVSQTLNYDLKGEFKKVEQPVDAKTDVKKEVKTDAKTNVKKEEKK